MPQSRASVSPVLMRVLDSPSQVPPGLIGSPAIMCLVFDASVVSCFELDGELTASVFCSFQENFPPNLVNAKAAVIEVMDWLLAPARVLLGC